MDEQKAMQTLRERVATHGQKAVANQLGYTPAAICAVLKGKYAGSPRWILLKVHTVYLSDVECPFSGASMTHEECRRRAQAPQPLGGAVKRQWWEHCQKRCDYNRR